jgi:hypothetical protein
VTERFDVAYLVSSGTSTAARCPELLRGLVGLGFSTVIAIPTPNASRVIAPRDLADVEGAQVVESYFDLAIRPRPPRGVVLFAPCSFNSLNKLAHGIADNLALSVVAEAIGRSTPVIVGPSLNAPLLEHPQAQASLRTLPTWGVTSCRRSTRARDRASLRPRCCWMPFAHTFVEPNGKPSPASPRTVIRGSASSSRSAGEGLSKGTPCAFRPFSRNAGEGGPSPQGLGG